MTPTLDRIRAHAADDTGAVQSLLPFMAIVLIALWAIFSTALPAIARNIVTLPITVAVESAVSDYAKHGGSTSPAYQSIHGPGATIETVTRDRLAARWWASEIHAVRCGPIHPDTGVIEPTGASIANTTPVACEVDITHWRVPTSELFSLMDRLDPARETVRASALMRGGHDAATR